MLWLAAALLAYLAPGHLLYKTSLVNLSQDFPLRRTVGWDGWGEPVGAIGGTQGRFGYALWTGAALLLVTGVATLWSTARPLPAAPRRAAAYAVPALLAGVVLMLGLGVRGGSPDAIGFNTYGAPVDQGIAVVTWQGPSLGPSFWLALAAAIAALLAAAAQLAGSAVTRRFAPKRTAPGRAA